MSIGAIVCAILAPALFWGVYHYRKDRHRPEPVRLLGLSYLLGIGSGLIAVQGYRLSVWLGAPGDPYALAESDKLGFFVYAVLIVGGIEELAKFLPFWLVCLRFAAFDEKTDGVIYASVVALGFASYENLLYLGFLQGVELYARAVASPLTHALFASIWGYASARALIGGRSLLRGALIGLAISAAAHGLYDFILLAAPPLLRPLPAAIILGVWIWRMRLLRRASAS